MSLRFNLAMLASKTAVAGLKLFRRNAGQLPGYIAEKIDPAFLAHIDKPKHVVFVSGTNGKTTTNNLLNDLLIDNDVRLVNNRVGGNIANGIESTFIKNASLSGKQRVDTAVMELDELSFRRVLPYVTPEIILVTNLYRDSFTRNANPEFIFAVMSENISPQTKLILNADDLISCRLAPQNKNRVYFSLGPLADDAPAPQGLACDLTACPECGGKLEYEYCHVRHLGKAHCTSCGFGSPEPDYEVIAADRDACTFTVREGRGEDAPTYTYKIAAYSITNLYNLFAATVVAREMGISPEAIAASLERGINVTASRYSEYHVGGKRLVAHMSKGENGAATSVVLDVLRHEAGNKVLLLMLSDAHKAADPKSTENIGWYYQIDFEYLTEPEFKQVIIQGATSPDLLLRLRLAKIDPAKIVVAQTPEEAADAVDLGAADSIYWAYDMYNGHDVEACRKRLIERIEAGETAPRTGAAAGEPAGQAQVNADAHPVIELLYPEFGNQAGAGGNEMYLRACLPGARFIETSKGDVPYFANARPDFILMCGMTEAQQETVIQELLPYRDRLQELIDDGVPMLFCGNAPEVLCREIADARGTTVAGLGLIDARVERDMGRRFVSVQEGTFEPGNGAEPIDVVGFKIQFTQVEGDNSAAPFVRLTTGWGLNEQSSLEGFCLKNCIATWMIGPELPLNPPLAKHLISLMGADQPELAFEEEAMAAYAKRVKEFRTPGIEIPL